MISDRSKLTMINIDSATKEIDKALSEIDCKSCGCDASAEIIHAIAWELIEAYEERENFLDELQHLLT